MVIYYFFKAYLIMFNIIVFSVFFLDLKVSCGVQFSQVAGRRFDFPTLVCKFL